METERLAELSNEKGKVYLTLDLLNGKTMLQTWNGFVPNEIFRKGIDKIIDLAKKHFIPEFIVDISKSSGVGVDSQAYAAKRLVEYTTYYKEKKSKDFTFKQVMIFPNDIFAKISAQGYADKAQKDDNGITTFMAVTLERALELLNISETISK